MKKIEIQKLELHNFKGARNLTVDFKHTTNIYGDNATLKTTIMDAFIWLLFGKDSTDRKDFQIKTLDENNNVIPKIDHTVTGWITIDSTKTKLQRTVREKWVKKRGSEETEFSGNETLFWVDEVPYQAQQYKTYINTIVDELLFKMVTNPLFFNGMAWKDRRDVLMKIAGPIDEPTDPRYDELLDRISGKSFELYRTELLAKKKKLKDELDLIPARIDEVTRSIPEEVDIEAVNAKIKGYEEEIAKIDDQIADKSKVSQEALKRIQDRQNKIHDLELEKNKLEFDEKNNQNREYNEKVSERSKLEQNLVGIENAIVDIAEQITDIETKIEDKTAKKAEFLRLWHVENEKKLEFAEGEFICPTCKQPLPDLDKEAKKAELTTKFNQEKVNSLQSISEQGKKLKAEIEALNAKLKELNESLPGKHQYKDVLKGQIHALKDIKMSEVDMSKNERYQEIIKEIDSLNKEGEGRAQDDTAPLKTKKDSIKILLDKEKAKLSVKEQIDKSTNRVKELEGQSRSLSQQIADLEKDEFVIEDYTRNKIKLVEESINALFKHVKVKMFNTLINGGIEECCDMLYKGVPFSDVNAAHKIWIGIDIINTLSGYYKISAPLFIDNRESTVKIPETNAQVINLFVSEKDKVLRIE